MFKVGEGRPNVVDEILNDNIQLVINTPKDHNQDLMKKRLENVSHEKYFNYYYAFRARAAIDSMKHLNKISVKALQEYFK